MTLSDYTLLDDKRSPKLTYRTNLVWDVVDAARLLDVGFENILKPSPERKGLHAALERLSVYDSKLKRILETTDQRYVP